MLTIILFVIIIAIKKLIIVMKAILQVFARLMKCLLAQSSNIYNKNQLME